MCGRVTGSVRAYSDSSRLVFITSSETVSWGRAFYVSERTRSSSLPIRRQAHRSLMTIVCGRRGAPCARASIIGTVLDKSILFGTASISTAPSDSRATSDLVRLARRNGTPSVSSIIGWRQKWMVRSGKCQVCRFLLRRQSEAKFWPLICTCNQL